MTDVFADVLDDFEELRGALDELPAVPSMLGPRAVVAALLVVAARLDWIARELHAATNPEAPE